ncbi:L-threonylcarbamoyladenylate synthase [Macrococcoides canis]|uniref:Threonylcarbamoyl-AMP synthase n=1 Tax=Macrococcoides canis TaxID=1855823 RepID=A0A4R6C3X4_9STAP|nr:L-threonylcarbamoyladenylate synthase [Macrococcus canis]MEE1108312.1 L-threonylcarbamoyladenylate synthase [Macrococcus canis]TDM16315.1 threonylcarbamoyl-AMP synthase [Macrococcus canis]TDM19988.1 threonylcarbamoyl-AMP synthase [Macrococcus canis]TDM21147.1 threonylcarbamoyl-AMP synthase [Macrococcus canis]TDM32065.1 threonylcarbamoyl-AMP synthase [Macrococcus canis]
MRTNVWDVRNYVEDLSTYPHVHEIITGFKAGETIAIPTETVYGLAADATNSEAVAAIFKAKGRPQDNPLIVHIHHQSQLEWFTHDIHIAAYKLMDHFWPGPISFIVPVMKGVLAESVTAGLNTVAVRMPAHKVAHQLIEMTDLLLAAPSANTSGKPSPTKAEHVIHDMDGKIFGIVQSEQVEVGIESTVVDCSQYPFRIARPGAITRNDLEAVVPGCMSDEHIIGDKPIAPGMKYRHYAPDSPLELVDCFESLELSPNEAVIAPLSEKDKVNGGWFFALGATYEDSSGAMYDLYNALRSADNIEQIEKIYITDFTPYNGSDALMNRINKAVTRK